MQMKLLYINACIRDESRTNRLARFLIDQIVKMDDIVEEVKLDEKHLHPLDREALKERSLLLFQDVIDHPVFEAAHQFAQADQIIISAPYYDLSFPSLLKVYLENICVASITYDYHRDGSSYGLCKATKLYYVTTAGSRILDDTYGYGYIKALCTQMFGIQQTYEIKVDCLDMVDTDTNALLEKAKDDILRSFK